MEDANTLGRLVLPDGRKVSARLAAAKQKIDEKSDSSNQRAFDPPIVEDLTLTTGAIAAEIEAASTGGGNRKMRGGVMEQTKAAITQLRDQMVTEQGRVKEGFDSSVASLLLAIPGVIRQYGPPVAKATGFGALIKYPTVFAKMVAGAVKIIPLPAGGSWSQYGQAASIIIAAFKDLGVDITSQAVLSPVIAASAALYIQSQRAKSQGITLTQVFVNDAVAAKGAAINAINSQIEAYQQAYAAQTKENPLENLRQLADEMLQQRTESLVGKITGAQLEGDVLKITPDPKATPERLAKRARTEPSSPESSSGEGPASAATMTPMRPMTASSSMEDATGQGGNTWPPRSSGGRRRKTRKPKRVRRVTRRRRAIVY